MPNCVPFVLVSFDFCIHSQEGWALEWKGAGRICGGGRAWYRRQAKHFRNVVPGCFESSQTLGLGWFTSCSDQARKQIDKLVSVKTMESGENAWRLKMGEHLNVPRGFFKLAFRGETPELEWLKGPGRIHLLTAWLHREWANPPHKGCWAFRTRQYGRLRLIGLYDNI